MEYSTTQSITAYCNMHKRILTSLLLFCSLSLYAQIDEEMARVDSITYAQYYRGEWKQLLQTADKVIAKKQDFYWLNVRAAIAANMLSKPYLEKRYLQKIATEFPYDPVTLPILYNNELTTGQYAHALQSNHRIQSDTLLAKYYPRRPIVHLIAIEGGYKPSSNSSLYKPLYYSQAGIGFRIGTIPLHTAFSYLSQQSYLGTMNQHQYYLTGAIPLKRNWTVAPAFHVLRYTINNTIAVADSSQLSHTSFLGGINISKLHRNLHYQVGIYYSTLNNEKQLQIQPAVTWYPLFNNKLSLTINGNYITQSNKIITSLAVTYNPIRFIGLTGGYLAADSRYFSEQNGLLINNSYDITGKRYLGMITINPTLSWSCFIAYLHETKKFSNQPFPDISYTYDMLVTGIKRTF